VRGLFSTESHTRRVYICRGEFSYTSRSCSESNNDVYRDFITKVIYAHLDQDRSGTREPASKQVDRGAKRPARPSPTMNDEARKIPSSNRSPSPRVLPCADTTCRVVVAANDADGGCRRRRRRGDTPLQERSGSTT